MDAARRALDACSPARASLALFCACVAGACAPAGDQVAGPSATPAAASEASR
ncbi:MAG: hypothetical protein RL112_2229, partial [Planctomycetota bacterium]